jgi:hypothetical protein
LKVIIEPINNNRVQLIGLVKKGALYTVFRKSADFYTEEKSAGVISVYE